MTLATTFAVLVVATFYLHNVVGDILDPQSVNQDECVTSNPVSAIDTLWFFEFEPNYYYVSMGNKHLYRSYAQVFLGRPADTDKDDTTNFNLKIQFLATYAVRTTGFNGKNYFRQQCIPVLTELALTKATCIPVKNGVVSKSNSQNVDLTSINTSLDTIVWQNKDAKAVLITRCTNNTVGDWKVLSQTPTLSSEWQEVIYAEVNRLGFTDDNPENKLV